MPKLEGSCHCSAVTFSVESHGRAPFMKCYCSICRKTAGSTGPAINLGGDASTLKVTGEEHISIYQATIDGQKSPMERRFCKHCGTHLWGYDPRWPELVHPFAGVIDSDLPKPPETVHIMLNSAPTWVDVPAANAKNLHFAEYPELSIEDWHRQHGMWGS
jgi:hypothetical protein